MRSFFPDPVLILVWAVAFGAWMTGVLHDLTGSYGATFVISGACVMLACAPFWISDRLRAPTSLEPPPRAA